MVRRARQLAGHLVSEFEIEVLPRPSMRELFRTLGKTELVYVIDPGRIGFPAALAARLARRCVVVEMGDPQSALYRAQGRGPASILAGALIDRIMARWASAAVLRGRGLAEFLAIRVPWVEIPDGVDIDLFHPGSGDGLREELGIPSEALVAGLAGSLSSSDCRGYGWDLVEALGELRGEPVWGLIVGDGDAAGRLRKRAEQLGVAARLVMPGRVPHREVPRYLCAMDVCISTQSNDAVGRSRTTAKLPEYLACDRYILATAVGAAAEVLPPEMLLPYAGSHDPSHPERVAGRLAALLPRQADLRRGAGTRPIALQRYSYPVLAERLGEFLRRVID